MSNLFMDALSAMGNLSVQSGQTAEGLSEGNQMTAELSESTHMTCSQQVRKDKLVIPKVKREPLSDHTATSNRESAPASERKRAAAKHSKSSAPAKVDATEIAAMAPQCDTAEHSAEQDTGKDCDLESSCQQVLSFAPPADEVDATGKESSPTVSFAHEQYDMRFRGPTAIQGMLEAITEARSSPPSPTITTVTTDAVDRAEPDANALDAQESTQSGHSGMQEKLAHLTFSPDVDPKGRSSPPHCTGTLVMFDQVFLDHRTGKGCQECPERMDILCGSRGALTAAHGSPLDFEQNIEEAPLADILRVYGPPRVFQISQQCECSPSNLRRLTWDCEGRHDWEYISELRKKCAAVSACKDGKEKPLACLDPPGHPQDTVFCESSFKVAATAAGAVCRAVDRVMQQHCHNAFVAARPPGHHAGPRGLVHTDDGRPSLSQGFCLLNSVAIGAAYCKYNYRHLGIKRIAIVDFDIHNGDGTAECVRNLSPHEVKRRIGRGMELSSTSYKPWVDESDAEDVLFASLHLCANNFYPRMAAQSYCSGSTPEWELLSTGHANDPAHPNILNIPLRKTTSKADAAALWRTEVQAKLLPRLTSFKPDVVFLSAGFDGHVEDTKGNNGWFHLVEDDYHWVTARLCEVAERCCGGRLVSVLEGGYHIERAPPAAPRHSRRKSSAVPPPAAKMPGALATSVSAHVRALQEASHTV